MDDKILFISQHTYPDYMSDVILHGGRSLLGENFIEIQKIDYMYDDYEYLASIYGRGFTIFGKLDSKIKIDRENIEYKIKNKYYKAIIYGSVFRSMKYFDIVKNVYGKKEIIFIDGEDGSYLHTEILEKGLYFKRELQKKDKMVYPIQFAIPEQLIINFKPKKTKDFATVIPFKGETYIFTDEKSYYEDYQKSYFGITCKKAGWDCMRHYEIMMNYCFPYFEDLKDCPTLTMFRLPKKTILKGMEKLQSKNFNCYEEFMEEIKENLIKKLTTKKMFEYILEYIS